MEEKKKNPKEEIKPLDMIVEDHEALNDILDALEKVEPESRMRILRSAATFVSDGTMGSRGYGW